MSCCSCHLDLRSTTFIKCAECTTPSIELCLLCFTGKYESLKHSPSHSYYVLSGEHLGQASLHDATFGNLLILLDCSRKFSVGSWADVCNRSKLHTPGECENAFMRLYDDWKRVCGHNSPAQDFQMDSSQLQECTGKSSDGLIVHSLPIASASSDLPGFIANRVDFEVEYDDSAELILADIELGDDDSAEERAIKMECLKAFTERMHRRESIKAFVTKSGLTTVQSQIDHHRCRTSEEVELRGKLRPIARFFENADQFESFVQIVLHERRIISRLQQVRMKREGDQKLVTPVPAADSVDDAIKDSKDLAISKPATRGRVAMDNRRGRTAEDECARVNEAIQSDSWNTAGSTTTDPKDLEFIEQLGLGARTFSILRDVVLRKCALSGAKGADIQISKFGDTLRLDAIPND